MILKINIVMTTVIVVYWRPFYFLPGVAELPYSLLKSHLKDIFGIWALAYDTILNCYFCIYCKYYFTVSYYSVQTLLKTRTWS